MVTDELGRGVIEQYPINILPNVSGWQGEIRAAMGGAYTDGIAPVTTNASGPVEFEYVNLPAGMTWSTTTGIVSGTPTVSGSFTVGLIVKDESSTSARMNFAVNVVNPVKHRFWRLTAGNATAYRGLQFLDEHGQSHASKILNGNAKVYTSDAPTTPVEAYKALFNTSSQFSYSGWSAWVWVDFGEPVSVTKVYNAVGNSFIGLWWSEDGVNWTSTGTLQHDFVPDTQNFLIRRRS